MTELGPWPWGTAVDGYLERLGRLYGVPQPTCNQLEANWLTAKAIGKKVHPLDASAFADHLTVPLGLLKIEGSWAYWLPQEQTRLAGRFGVPVAAIRRQQLLVYPLPGYRLSR